MDGSGSWTPRTSWAVAVARMHVSKAMRACLMCQADPFLCAVLLRQSIPPL